MPLSAMHSPESTYRFNEFKIDYSSSDHVPLPTQEEIRFEVVSNEIKVAILPFRSEDMQFRNKLTRRACTPRPEVFRLRYMMWLSRHSIELKNRLTIYQSPEVL